MLRDLDVIIEAGPALLPLGVDVGLSRQWFQRWLVQCLKQRAAARAEMLGHGGKGLVERRFEPQRLDDPGLQIVADDRFGNPAEVRQGPGLAFDPVW